MNLRPFIESRLDDMLNRGRGPMWGGPEAFELQALLLLELLYCPDAPETLMPYYRRFFAPRHPTMGCSVLSSIISDHDVLANELRALKASLDRDIADYDASRGHE